MSSEHVYPKTSKLAGGHSTVTNKWSRSASSCGVVLPPTANSSDLEEARPSSSKGMGPFCISRSDPSGWMRTSLRAALPTRCLAASNSARDTLCALGMPSDAKNLSRRGCTSKVLFSTLDPGLYNRIRSRTDFSGSCSAATDKTTDPAWPPNKRRDVLASRRVTTSWGRVGSMVEESLRLVDASARLSPTKAAAFPRWVLA
mmetsp:Transcript_54038/g.143843  ORF Transcript_54038/g.143843 Transcript_54038/m.143843 type:complete len:201 (+) Transcript_54038:241-843(+)